MVFTILSTILLLFALHSFEDVRAAEKQIFTLPILIQITNFPSIFNNNSSNEFELLKNQTLAPIKVDGETSDGYNLLEIAIENAAKLPVTNKEYMVNETSILAEFTDVNKTNEYSENTTFLYVCPHINYLREHVEKLKINIDDNGLDEYCKTKEKDVGPNTSFFFTHPQNYKIYFFCNDKNLSNRICLVHEMPTSYLEHLNLFGEN